MEFGNGNSYDLALLVREYVCACDEGEGNLSVGNLRIYRREKSNFSRF